ncbi:hypothetical protein HXX76_004927 [Chlamydomonas incerta]|uniref:DNA recombination and repair protein Rad51-like C-terminal domain-containing protein n=1 Tax=Chlamydomonas incerta TaxID=51695 RepID=A0A835TIU7_CHLIN|nr:hypothetical protein HXX76_004927 [Chlamydomonas incerta]|eukprot:KAG2439575.1 hypothetical protein HXX76_004927 [Chlamydomonas incerta]
MPTAVIATVNAVPADIVALLSFNETGAQFFRRVQQERVLTGLQSIDSNVVLRPGVVLEVAGPPGSGKTELLLSVLLNVLVAPYLEPAAWVVRQQGQQQLQAGLQDPRAAGGGGGGGGGGGAGGAAHSPAWLPPPPPGAGQVVLLDLDGKFDIGRLAQLLNNQLQPLRADVARMRLATAQQQQQQRQQMGGRGPPAAGAGPGPPHQQQGQQQQQWGGVEAGTLGEEELLTEAQVANELLSRLHVVRCSSSMQLLAALVTMPARLEAWQAAGVGCRLLLLDNVGAHYWRDKAARNVAPPGGAGSAAGAAGGGGGAATPYHAQHHQHMPPPPSQQQHTPAQQQQLQQGRPGGAAIAARLQLLARKFRLPVIATKAAAVTARGLGGDGDWQAPDGGTDSWGPRPPGSVQLQQREFMPMPWQNVVTHRLLLYPRGVTNSGPAATGAAGAGATQSRTPVTTVWAELQGTAGAGAAAGAAGAAGGAAGGGTAGPGTPGGRTGGRCLSRLVIALAAMIEI